MAADDLAPYVARTSAAMLLTMYIEYVGPGLTWWRILSICTISMWSNDIKCKYVFTFPLKNLARKGLIKMCAPTCINCTLGKLRKACGHAVRDAISLPRLMTRYRESLWAFNGYYMLPPVNILLILRVKLTKLTNESFLAATKQL